MRRVFKTGLLEAIHETARDLYRLGLMEGTKLREFDALCLPPAPSFDAARVRALRERHHLSQTVFAKVLNADLATVRRWEIGERRPSGPYCKLLDLLERKGVEGLL